MGLWSFLSKLLGSKEPTQATTPVTGGSTPVTNTPVVVPSPVQSPPRSGPTLPSPPTPNAQPNPFLPISRSDLLKQGEEVRRTTGWMFFGRRDLIPPISDPRTLLIDRGMVTQRLLTPEELEVMHRVGDAHARFANRLEQVNIEAGKNAEQAVEADRAARAALKVQKKAEAVARRQKQQEAITIRKITDIIFVGRGVSALMNDRDSDALKLTSVGLPALSTPSDLAAALGITVPQLRWLCFHTEVATRIHYVQFEVPKKSGGVRTLSAPHKRLAAAQEWILGNILAKLPTEEAAHGFVPGRSTVTNASQHTGRDLVINVDLEAFFPSIPFRRVSALFCSLGYSGAVSTLLALLTTECPRRKITYDNTVYYVATGPRGLPQGACTSPALSNQISRRLDRRLSAISNKLGFTYTRYADDLTFSAEKGLREKIGYLLARIRHICDDEGFRLNPKKTRIQRPETRQSVTGLVVNVKPAVPRKVIRQIRAILHRAQKEGLEAQNRGRHPNFLGWLEGMIAYINMSNPELGTKLLEQFHRLRNEGTQPNS